VWWCGAGTPHGSGSGPNTSPHRRRSVILRYADARTLDGAGRRAVDRIGGLVAGAEHPVLRALGPRL